MQCLIEVQLMLKADSKSGSMDDNEALPIGVRGACR